MSADSDPITLGPVQLLPELGIARLVDTQRKLRHKTMALCVLLASRAPALVTRDVIAQELWPRAAEPDHAISRAVHELRKELTLLGAPNNLIETVPKLGYRVGQNAGSVHPAPPLATKKYHQDRSIAVMPFRNLSRSVDHEYLAAGITDDLVKLLSMVPRMRVVPLTSATFFAELGSPTQAVAKELGARYMVTGGTELRGERFRLRVTLIDAITDTTTWSESFDNDMSAFYEVQDRLVQRIASALSTEINQRTVANLREQHDFNLDVYQCLQLAEAARRNYNQDAALRIVELLHQALTLEPNHGVAHAMLAMQLHQNLVSRWTDDPVATRNDAQQHLDAALKFAFDDPQVQMAAGISALMRGDHAEAAEYLRESLRLNPNEPHALAELGFCNFYLDGDLERCLQMIREAEESAPRHPRYAIWAYRRGIALYEAGQIEASLAAYNEAVRRAPTYHHIHLTKAVALCRLNDAEAMRQSIAKGVELAPGLRADEYIEGVAMFGLTVSDEQAKQLRDNWI
ncbi:MAG: tetratricopeptide repeat protein [Pseudomonadota bacterium]